MKSLGKEQEKFSRLHMLLLLHIHALGYSVREKYLLRCNDCPVGHKRSVHKSGLAIDLVISISPSHDVDPKVITGDKVNKIHSELHDYWDSINGAKRINGDLGHYSLSWNGMR